MRRPRAPLGRASHRARARVGARARATPAVGAEQRGTAFTLALMLALSFAPLTPAAPATAASGPSTVVPASIYPLLRMKGCGHGNLQRPQVLRAMGRGRFVVDVGLGHDAKETLDAVEAGFVVFAFEPLPANTYAIRLNVARRKLMKRVAFVEMKHHPANDSWTWAEPPQLTAAQLEAKGRRGRGFAYVFHAGLSDESATVQMSDGRATSLVQSITGQDPAQQGKTVLTLHRRSVPVPVLTLDRALPAYVTRVHMLKIDSQGWEFRILRGAQKVLRESRVRYVQYEFSPWLMQRANEKPAGVGEPFELLKYLPEMGALCFDMMGTHNKLPRPSTLPDYFQVLDQGRNGDGSWKKVLPADDLFGPWDDITCYWPAKHQRRTKQQALRNNSYCCEEPRECWGADDARVSAGQPPLSMSMASSLSWTASSTRLLRKVAPLALAVAGLVALLCFLRAGGATGRQHKKKKKTHHPASAHATPVGQGDAWDEPAPLNDATPKAKTGPRRGAAKFCCQCGSRLVTRNGCVAFCAACNARVDVASPPPAY